MVIIIFLTLLILSAFFSGSETALLSLDKFRLQRMSLNNTVSSRRVVKLLSDPRVLFFTILTGNTLVNTAASACATIVAINIFGAKGVGIAISFMMIVLIFFGEVLPKTVAYLYGERISKLVVIPIGMAIKIFTPIRKILELITDRMISRLGLIVTKNRSTFTEDEIISLIKMGHKDGVVEEEEMTMLRGVFNFKDQTVADVMTPRIDMMAIDYDLDNRKVVEYARNVKHSRLPVYRESLDTVVGMVYAKDILFNQNTDFKKFIKKAYFVPESMSIDRLLSDLQRRSIQMAVVADEYGVTTGIITIEDILEEIVGDIVDEYDKEEPEIVQLDENTYRVSGLLHIDEANEHFELEIDSHEVDTMGGFAAMHLQKIPEENEEFVFQDFKIKVLKVDKLRVKELLLTRIHQ